MVKEEYLLRLAAIEQEMNRLEQQAQIIEQQALEMQILQKGLEEFEKSKEKQMLANLGRNIFVKTEVQDKNLFVDVGNRIFVKKNISETLKIVDEQLAKLAETKNRVMFRIQEVQAQTEEIITEAEKEK